MKLSEWFSLRLVRVPFLIAEKYSNTIAIWPFAGYNQKTSKKIKMNNLNTLEKKTSKQYKINYDYHDYD